MISTLEWWSHLSVALLVAAVVSAACVRRRTSVRALAGESLPKLPRAGTAWPITLLALAGGLGLSLVPVGEVDVAGYLLAYSGELSFATLFFLAVFLAAQSFPAVVPVEDRDWDAMRSVWAVVGLALYGSALTAWEPDLYAVGFGATLLWPVLAGSALLAVVGRWLAAVLLLGIVWSWQLRLSGGVNFWDYAIDPFLFVVSLARVGWSAASAAAVSGMKWGRERKLAVVSADNASATAS
jgi:hypothetical protein